MPSEVVARVLRKRQQPIGVEVQSQRTDVIPGGDGDHAPGHPHMEGDHEAMDRQHAYESACQGLKSLAKENMPGAAEMVKTLEKYWGSWQGQSQGPASIKSHRASPVTRTAMDQADELTSAEPQDSGDVTKGSSYG